MTLDPKLRNRGSKYANEGSAAHCLGEYAIKFMQKCIDEGNYASQVFDIDLIGTKLAQDPNGDYVVYEGEDPFGIQEHLLSYDDVVLSEDYFECDEEMQEGVRFYAETVLDIIGKCGGAFTMTIERRVYPIPGTDDVFGTADCVIYSELTGELWVIDLKYGKGVVVTAMENAQAMFYACGAGNEYHLEPEARVEIIICQPRVRFADGRRISDWVTTAGALFDWREAKLVPAVEETRSDKDKKYEMGDYCRWCPATALCPLMQALALKEAREAFGGDLDTLSFADAPEVSLILPNADDEVGLAKAKVVAAVLINWAKKVGELAENRALAGAKLEGFKLVRGQTRRKWESPEKTMTMLGRKGKIRAGTERKLRSPAQMEKLMGKPWVEKLMVKPEGALTLVANGDRRNAVEPVKLAFETVTPEEIEAVNLLLTGGESQV